MVYTETTSWAEPVLADWEPASVEELQLDTEGFYYRKILEMTDALLDAGQGRFLVGYTDLHGGGDAIAAFRDPQQLCIDLIEHPGEVRSLCDRITAEFLQVYDLYHEKLAAAGMPSTTWLGGTGEGRFHVPSNDFSCMISEQMFEDLFLPGLVQECRHMDRCIYHLDGPDALRHLDALLEIPEIQAIQWVPGAGRSNWKEWVDVYARIQAAGRAFVIYLPVRDLEALFEVLRPEGAWLVASGIGNQEEAEAALQAITRWR